MHTNLYWRSEPLAAAEAAADAASSSITVFFTASATSDVLPTATSVKELTTNTSEHTISPSVPSLSPEMLSDASPQQTEARVGHRNYIGIIITAVLVAVALLLWLFFSRSSRGIRRFCRRGGRRRSPSTAVRPQSVTLTPAPPSIMSGPPSPTTPMDPKGASTVKLLGLGSSSSGNLSPYATSDGGRSESVLDVEKGNTSEMEHSTSSQEPQQPTKTFWQKIGLRKT
ncbi:uncharacterized protein STEHIDRAFT_152205 [Stereum hirsutum FP-91666 SS1]|uniref:uncharacterized protein n=1 Tax=Stereum hirsutum (strain FP-91666) TaxID=721885 RepID=UPI000440ECEF|nr:uncharacterized protein STEHIDRAFT_152205 [Stereum hirsutum FP-91666 SS1]EIM92908.1 hypothetical protein STEHIDRAFT_152205 [Stereum hirsutum FP-91666 SS1]